jgi:LCP family protein required for cell wall assembly
VVGAMARRAMPVPPAVVAGQEAVQRREQVEVAAGPQLHDEDAGGRVRDEDVEQPVPAAGDLAEEPSARLGEVRNAPSCAGQDVELPRLHGASLSPARIPAMTPAPHPRARLPAASIALLVVLSACVGPFAPTPTPSPSPTASPTPSPTASPTASPTPSPTPTPTPNPLAGRRLTILVLGSDSTPARVAQGLGRLTDSIMVVSLNAADSKVSLISFPRDIVDIPLGNGQVWRQKINAIPFYLGEEAMVKAISATLQQPINYYIEINMVDFAAVVNAVGGIDVSVPVAIDDPTIGLNVKAGPQHMNGNLAQLYSRSRHTTSDWDRAGRQQLVLMALIRKITDPSTQINFLSLWASLKSMKTDLPIAQFVAFFDLARLAAKAQVVGKVLMPPQFATFWGIEQGTGRGYIQEPNIAAMRAYAASVMGN